MTRWLPDYWRNVVTVLGGTLLAQALPILLMPVISRLFAPSELGMYHLWLSAAAMLLVIGTARLDAAMFATSTEDDPYHLFVLLMVIATVVAIATSLIATFALPLTPWHESLLPVTAHGIALGIVVLLWSVFQGLLGLLVFRQAYARLGYARIGLAGSIVVLQLLAGVFEAGVPGLVHAHVLAAFIAVFLATYWAGVPVLTQARHANWRHLLSVLKRYRSFPLISVPAGLIGTAADHLPLFIIAARFGAEAAGWYALMYRVLSAPVGLIANSVLDVFKERAAREYRELGNCRVAYRTTLITLGLLAIAPFALLGWVSEPLFAWVFGEQWREAGRFAAILAPLFYLRFVASPLSYVVFIAEKQQFDLPWQVAVLVTVLLAIGFGPTIYDALRYYTAGYSALYIIYLAMSWRFAKGNTTR